MNFAKVLADVTGCTGVTATAIADRDGIPVESVGAAIADIEELVAEYSTFLRDVVHANRELQMGDLDQVLVIGRLKVVIVTTITSDYFLVTVVDSGGNPGKARFASRLAAFRMRLEFV
jgi:predicted regulator of Ras-like GTPase activity (Roadblock/LC7/MglB family)